MTKDKLKEQILKEFRAEGGFDSIPLDKACEWLDHTIDRVRKEERERIEEVAKILEKDDEMTPKRKVYVALLQSLTPLKECDHDFNKIQSGGKLCFRCGKIKRD